MDNKSAETSFTKPEIVGARLSTYVEIFQDLVKVFFTGDCSVWAEPLWLENTITIFVILATILYVYVISAIVINIRQIRSAFYLCALSLAVGDIVIMISAIRDNVARHYAWQTIGTFGMDCTLTSQLVMAVTRFTAIYTIPRQEFSRRVAKIGIVLSWIWTISMTIASHFGRMSHIWFENGVYRDDFRFPFLYIRIFILLLCIVGTFLIYCALLILTIRIRVSAKRADLLREMHMFAQCILIFFCELSFLYATFWFGFIKLHLGSAEFNANLNYVVRPLAIGLTPMIYVAFSTNLRQMLLRPFGFEKSRKDTTTSELSNYKQQNVNGNAMKMGQNGMTSTNVANNRTGRRSVETTF